MTVEIRKAVASDVADVAELFIASQADAVPFLRELHSAEETRGFIANQVFPQCDVWVALDDEKIVGMMALNASHLEHLYLQPGFYRRGIGTRLLAQAKALSPEKLTLYAFQKNARARAFYEHHGFAPIEYGDGSGNEAGEPDILYEWKG
jgi:ribosomal protein S18 acetylase RimI-like enzyme